MPPSSSCAKSRVLTSNPKRSHSAHSVISTALKSIALACPSSHEKAQEFQNKDHATERCFGIVACLPTLCFLCLFVAMKLTVLGSGSTGNAVLIVAGNTRV